MFSKSKRAFTIDNPGLIYEVLDIEPRDSLIERVDFILVSEETTNQIM